MTPREHARRWLHEEDIISRYDDPPVVHSLAAVLSRVAEEARATALEEACRAACFYCAEGCEVATKTAAGHDLPYAGTWHVNDVDPMVLSQCQASAIRALKAAR